MNFSIKTTALIAMSFLFSLPMTMSAKAISPDEAVNKLVDTVVNKATTSDAMKKQLCQKANVFSLTFSLRSGEGAGCKNQLWAGIAEVVCADFEGYLDSQCHKNAVATLGDKQPQDAIKEGVGKATAKVKTAVCAKKDKFPAQVQGQLAAACAA